MSYIGSIGEGIVSPLTMSNQASIPDEESVNEMMRYAEAEGLIQQGYKEQQYWLGVYQQAQQSGITGYTVQEVIQKLSAISQRLQNLQETIYKNAKTDVKSLIDGIKSAPDFLKTQ